MNTISKLTSQIGNVLAEIRERNKVIEAAQKRSNPTFMEIIEDLEKDDKTLCNMLLLWYCNKYLEDPVDMDAIVEDLKKVIKTKKARPSFGGGCGTSSYSSC